MFFASLIFIARTHTRTHLHSHTHYTLTPALPHTPHSRSQGTAQTRARTNTQRTNTHARYPFLVGKHGHYFGFQTSACYSKKTCRERTFINSYGYVGAHTTD